jgi:tetratricopeptide (TPR) repeat protein
MQKESYAQVTVLLKKAEVLTEHDGAGRAVTHNNWACLMRQQGKLNVALVHLRKALAIEEQLKKSTNNAADTHLNLCAVLSQLRRHADALVHAKSALDMLQAEIFGGLGDNAAKQPGGVIAAARKAGVKPDRVAALCIAYHNFGVENEFERNFTAALSSYTKGFELAKSFLGMEHSVTTAIQESQVAAAKTIKIEAAKAKRAAAKAAEEAAAGATATATAAGGGALGEKVD